MFKFESFNVNASFAVITTTNNRIKLINAFTGKEFWEDKDKVKYKYVLSTKAETHQIPEVIFTYSEFEYRIRTLVGEHNCFGLSNFDILRYPISKFFVYEFGAAWYGHSFGDIGKCDILEFEDWIEIFLSTSNAIKKYNQSIGNARNIFMEHNQLAPRIWKYLQDIAGDHHCLHNDPHGQPASCSYKSYFDEYIQNPYIDSTDVEIYYKERLKATENLGMGLNLDWDSVPSNIPNGKEFFIKYRHAFRSSEGSFIEDFDYWNRMSETSIIDTDGFLEYISGSDQTYIMKSLIWYKALFNLDLKNKGVTAYIEANPFILSFDHINNPTITIKWMKHIIHKFIAAPDPKMGHRYLYRIIDNSCLLEEDLVMFINYLKENNMFKEYQYKDTISNPNISEQFIEKEIFGRFKEFDGYVLDDIYNDPRITSYFIEKYILAEHIHMLNTNSNITAISKNPNIKELHIQTIIDFIKTGIDNGPYPSVIMYLDWFDLIANTNISMEFLVKNAQYMH